MVEHSANSLIEILRERDVPYNRDEIKAVFEDPEQQTAIRAWMDEYLSPETLLTREEAILYETLVKNGGATSAALNPPSIRGLSDKDIQTAIEELKRSTAAIEKQTDALRAQQNALSTLVKSNARSGQARSQTDKSQQRKWTVEKGQISAAVEELGQSLKYQTTDLDQQSKATENSVKQSVENILRSDDKLLLSLQKLANDLEPMHQGDGSIDRIRELCARLIKHTVEGIRTRLDRIYLEALTASKDQERDEESQEVVELQEELESLYSEILPVAQMSAEQQYLEPALREIAARDGHSQERSVKAFKYINDCLSFLVNRIEVFLERAEEHQSHQVAMQYVLGEAKKELSSPDPSQTTMTVNPVKPNTQRRRKSSGSKSPVQLRNRRRSSGQQDDDIEPEQQLLRHLGITLPSDVISDRTHMEVFERALSDRLTKLEIHTASLQSTTESSITLHLTDAHTTMQMLRDSLLAESLYNKVQLLDPDIECSIAIFEDEINALQGKLEAVNLQKLHAKNVNREQFIERWSR